jgi:hypothetical protein
MSLALVPASEELRLGDQSNLLACVAQLGRRTGIDSGKHLLGSRWYVAAWVKLAIDANTVTIGQYSVTAKITVVVTAACSAVAASLFLLYNMVMLKLVKKKHEREIRDAERWNYGDVASQQSGRHDV